MGADNPRFTLDSSNYWDLYQEATKGKEMNTWDDALASVSELLLQLSQNGYLAMNVDDLSRLARRIIKQGGGPQEPDGSDPDQFRHMR